jgi:predicted HAD superfamily phosphohydrolase YqeG
MRITREHVLPQLQDIRFIYFDLDDTLIDHKKAQDRAMVDVWTQYEPLQKVNPGQLTTVYGEVNN